MEGSFSYTTSENYDDFLKERGVPWIGRKLIIAAPVQLEISKQDDLWTITYNNPARTTTFQFKLDSPFEHAGSYEKIEETLVTLGGEETLVMTNDVGNITSAGTMTRTFSFSKDGIEETLFSVKQNVSCKRIYTRK